MQNNINSKYTGIEELLTLELMKNYNNSIVKDSIKFSTKSKTVVDFGAGIGTLSMIFRENYKKEPICVEIDKTNIKYLKERKFKCFKNLKSLEEPVDLIFSSNVLEHIKNDYQILSEIRKKLKEDGTLFLYVPAKMILWSKLDESVGHYRRYEISKLRALCKKSGFKIAKIHYADCIGFFLTLLWRYLNISRNTLPSKKALFFYDKYISPVSRFLDNLGFKYLVGKNIILVAKNI